MKLSDILQEDRASRTMMGVVIAVDDALERVRLLDARRQGRGRWGSSHFPEPDAALNTGQTRTSGALDIKWQPLQLAVRQYHERSRCQ